MKKTNKYLMFNKNYIDLNDNEFPAGVKFRIIQEDRYFYYINGNSKVDKKLEDIDFTVGEIIYGN